MGRRNWSQLQEKFEPGQTLICKGSSIPESQKFNINFHHKAADFSGNDVPLHISVRFDEGKIILNSFTDGQWGKEQRKSSPIKRGEPFDIRVRAHDDRFQIIIDHKEFTEYEHRLPLSNITHFSVDGDIYLNSCLVGRQIPFEKGHGFDLVIVNEETHFDILVNDQPFTTFAHRTDPNDIAGLQISGDIELVGLQIH
ncbi:Galectin [Aphelenchoides fujianensis]|nr:Galectin [Aphelenchoides fujianensis]